MLLEDKSGSPCRDYSRESLQPEKRDSKKTMKKKTKRRKTSRPDQEMTKEQKSRGTKEARESEEQKEYVDLGIGTHSPAHPTENSLPAREDRHRFIVSRCAEQSARTNMAPEMTRRRKCGYEPLSSTIKCRVKITNTSSASLGQFI
ncbi:hypothetical protein B296_00026658 [Ensete ventricosum]|uniref:Uncharacterized protein n=1 Tax=Ensete ventricosum TaxID=4639 RepID=A0A426ZUB6_ENSVE|nr:hypothetical protein B296_00026658 [Ensete ventricosum]